MTHSQCRAPRAPALTTITHTKCDRYQRGWSDWLPRRELALTARSARCRVCAASSASIRAAHAATAVRSHPAPTTAYRARLSNTSRCGAAARANSRSWRSQELKDSKRPMSVSTWASNVPSAPSNESSATSASGLTTTATRRRRLGDWPERRLGYPPHVLRLLLLRRKRLAGHRTSRLPAHPCRPAWPPGSPANRPMARSSAAAGAPDQAPEPKRHAAVSGQCG
jgi:hypothetical protein